MHCEKTIDVLKLILWQIEASEIFQLLQSVRFHGQKSISAQI